MVGALFNRRLLLCLAPGRPCRCRRISDRRGTSASGAAALAPARGPRRRRLPRPADRPFPRHGKPGRAHCHRRPDSWWMRPGSLAHRASGQEAGEARWPPGALQPTTARGPIPGVLASFPSVGTRARPEPQPEASSLGTAWHQRPVLSTSRPMLPCPDSGGAPSACFAQPVRRRRASPSRSGIVVLRRAGHAVAVRAGRAPGAPAGVL